MKKGLSNKHIAKQVSCFIIDKGLFCVPTEFFFRFLRFVPRGRLVKFSE